MTGWPVFALGDLCSISLGATPPRASPRFWDKGKETSNVWLSIADMPTTLHSVVSDSKEYLSNEGAARGKIVKEGTLLVSFKLTLGRLAYAGCDLRTNEAIAALSIRDAQRIEKEYLYWYLTYFDWQKAAEGEDKVKGKTLNKKKLKVLPVLVPSLDEQRRIVAVLNNAFAAIATATANAERNIANARELPSAALSHFDLVGAGAQRRRLGDLVDRLTNGYVGPTRNIYVSEGVPYLLARHVRDDVLTFDGRTHITASFNESNKKSKLVVGDVLLVQSGHIGHSAVVPPEHAGHNCHAMIVITPKPALLGEYLSAYFNSVQGRDATARIRSGSTVPHLTCKEVRELRIPLPSVEAQRLLVEKYKAIQQRSAVLVDLYEGKVGKLTALKQSLLQRAFSGELTEREPLAA